MTTLTGHTSAETAYVVADYPYGFRLRTQIRYWIDTKKGHGQRMVSQTLNPKNNRWNAPKAGTYSAAMCLTLNEDTGHVEHIVLSSYSSEEEIAAYEAAAPDDNYTREVIRYLRAARRAEARITWTVSSHTCTLQPDCPQCQEPHQTIKEQAQFIQKLTEQELWRESLDAIKNG